MAERGLVIGWFGFDHFVTPHFVTQFVTKSDAFKLGQGLRPLITLFGEHQRPVPPLCPDP